MVGFMLLQSVPEQPLKMMEKYGLAAVGLVVLALFSFFLVRQLLKRLTAQDKKLDALIERLLEDKEKESSEGLNVEKLDKFAKSANKIQQLTYYLLNEIEAERISIFEYHNGGKTITGVDFKKCSNTYEAVELGIESKYRDYQNIPISTNVLWNKLLLDKKPISIYDISELKETDNSIYIFLSSQGIQSYYSRLILDYDNKPIGFLVITYYTNKVRLEEEHLKVINDATITIAGLINK